jgi:hypothetical protein
MSSTQPQPAQDVVLQQSHPHKPSAQDIEDALNAAFRAVVWLEEATGIDPTKWSAFEPLCADDTPCAGINREPHPWWVAPRGVDIWGF